LPRQRRPPERPLALAEQRPDIGGNEPGERERAPVAGQLGLAADRVAVVEHLGARVLEPDHGLHVGGHRLPGPRGEAGWVLGAQRAPPPLIVTASGCAPPIRRSPAVSVTVPASDPPNRLAATAANVS